MYNITLQLPFPALSHRLMVYALSHWLMVYALGHDEQSKIVKVIVPRCVLVLPQLSVSFLLLFLVSYFDCKLFGVGAVFSVLFIQHLGQWSPNILRHGPLLM